LDEALNFVPWYSCLAWLFHCQPSARSSARLVDVIKPTLLVDVTFVLFFAFHRHSFLYFSLFSFSFLYLILFYFGSYPPRIPTNGLLQSRKEGRKKKEEEEEEEEEKLQKHLLVFVSSHLVSELQPSSGASSAVPISETLSPCCPRPALLPSEALGLMYTASLRMSPTSPTLQHPVPSTGIGQKKTPKFA